MNCLLRSVMVVSVVALACGSGSEAGPAAPPEAPEAPAALNTVAPPDEPTPPAAATVSDADSMQRAAAPSFEGVNTGSAMPSGAAAPEVAPVNEGMTPLSTGAESGGAEEPGASASESAPTFHVFLLLGQSNMAGYPKAQPADRVEDPRVRVLGFDTCAATGRQPDVWDTAAPPLHECWNDGLGPGDYFAKSLLAVLAAGDTLGLVPSAISGERIETFLKVGGTKYDWILQRARLAQQAGGKIDGILFHQGESNNGDPSWPEKVKTLVTDLRSDLGLGPVPFLAGELLYSGGAAGHNRLVAQLPSLISNAYVISANGLVVDPADTQWNLHFDHDSQVEFGKRYAQQMKDALGW
jgi:hypothetical protein